MLPKLLKSLSSWPATLTVSLLILVGATAVKLWPRTVPFSQCSEVYQKYAGNPDIDASFIKDFRINDTLAVDVTVLKAKDSSGWETMLADFDIRTPPPNFMQRISNGEDIISCKFILDNDTTHISSSGTRTNAIIAISRIKHTLTFFNITQKSHKQAILQYNFPYPNNNQKQ